MRKLKVGFSYKIFILIINILYSNSSRSFYRQLSNADVSYIPQNICGKETIMNHNLIDIISLLTHQSQFHLGTDEITIQNLPDIQSEDSLTHKSLYCIPLPNIAFINIMCDIMYIALIRSLH